MTKHVEVYRNLHNGKFSVRDHKTKRVLAHCDEVTLAGAVFKVSQAGRERVLRERKKNVHAVVMGKLLEYRGAEPYKGRSIADHVWQWADGIKRLALIGTTKATYNPYKYASFVVPEHDYAPIRIAKSCRISNEGIHIGVLDCVFGKLPNGLGQS